jgi:hypothetical protein
MTRPRIRSGLVAAAIGAAATLLVVACQAVPAATAPTAQSRLAHTVELHATEFSYAVPAPLPAGLVTLQTTNDGDEPHHVQLLRLNSGVTYERFATALQAEGEAAVRLTPRLVALV